MSHYNVAVIMDGTKSLEDLLAPYDETTEDRKYSEFCDIEDEYREKYENEGDKKVKMLQDGSLVDIYDEQFLVEISEGMYNLYRQDENIRTSTRWNKGQQVFYRYDYGVNEVVDVPYKETYATFEEFMSEYGGYTRDEEKNRYGYWHNPNAKWDWWQVGGRWVGMLKAKDGRIGEQSLVYPKKVTPGFFDIAKIKDIDFTPDKDAYDRAIRFWEVVVEEQPLKEGEVKEHFDTFWRKEYYEKQYGTKEQYARECSELSTFAVVTADGVWHEKGQMGWFGCSSETGEESQKWHNSWYDAFIKDTDPEQVLVIVDCHI